VRLNPHWKKEENTTISVVLVVGISSLAAGRHGLGGIDSQ
jgi:hypothetical protein